LEWNGLLVDTVERDCSWNPYEGHNGYGFVRVNGDYLDIRTHGFADDNAGCRGYASAEIMVDWNQGSLDGFDDVVELEFVIDGVVGATSSSANGHFLRNRALLRDGINQVALGNKCTLNRITTASCFGVVVDGGDAKLNPESFSQARNSDWDSLNDPVLFIESVASGENGRMDSDLSIVLIRAIDRDGNVELIQSTPDTVNEEQPSGDTGSDEAGDEPVVTEPGFLEVLFQWIVNGLNRILGVLGFA